jgi:class 3 adenylate cyclase
MERNGKTKHSILYTLLSIPLRFKISVPYLIVASLLAGLATFIVGRSLLLTLEERFQSQLEDSVLRASAGILDVEAIHLRMIRTIAFTTGMPEAVLGRDFDTLNRLVFPHIANNSLYFVDVLDSSGEPIASWHKNESANDYRQNEFAPYKEWNIVQRVLLGEIDQNGDKFVNIIDTPWGLALYTAGPIRTTDDRLGVILIGTPFPKIVQSLSLLSLSNITLYQPNGESVVSTFATETIDPLDVQSVADILREDGALATRDIVVLKRGYKEAVKNLSLRGESTEWYLGVALAESLVREAQLRTAPKLILTFIAGVLALIGLGVVVAQLIAAPVFRLLAASQEIGSGNLNVRVRVQANDEIGQLTRGFNRMAVDLRNREFIREMFGRMVSEDVREAVLNDQVNLGGEARDVTVLFVDVRGFTTMVEKSEPQEIVNLLNQFFGIVTRATHVHHGGVNYFGGDSVMAIFGAPIVRPVKETIQQAIWAALDIQWGVLVMNAKRISKGLEPVRYGIGIDSGPVVAGNMGSPDRFTYTVIGDVVNVAARLQDISREFPRTPTLIPKTVVDVVQGELDVEFQYLNDFSLKGRERPVATYGVLGSKRNIHTGFNFFDLAHYTNYEALMACGLYCLEYDDEIIGEALQIPAYKVQQWVETAKDHRNYVGQVLINEFKLSRKNLTRLMVANLPKNLE